VITTLVPTTLERAELAAAHALYTALSSAALEAWDAYLTTPGALSALEHGRAYERLADERDRAIARLSALEERIRATGRLPYLAVPRLRGVAD